MLEKPLINKQDCRFFHFDRPCKYHKDIGIVCRDCGYYSKIVKKILIIKLDALGDVLRTMAILPSLKNKYPDAAITWVTRGDAIPLFDNIESVDEVLDYTDPYTNHLLQTVDFDLILNPDANKSAIFMTSVARGKEKRGFYLSGSQEIIASNDKAHKWFDMGINDELKKQNTMTYQQIVMEIFDLDVDSSHIPLELGLAEVESARIFSKKNGLDKKRPVIGLNIGAGDRWQNKAWPVEHYKTLIDHLLSKQHQILLLGGVAEKHKMNILEKEFGDKVVSGGWNNSLRDFFSILNVCDVMVSSDTMAVHAALALGKKVVVLFGPTSLNEVEVYGRGIKLSADMDCLVCYMPSCDEKPGCMDLLAPELVENAILKLL